ncbi:MAG TPA: LysR family transcriptional regulator [Caulobacteraceae bacterium]|jgi:DNA-binding transcriptional LysR family regulator|nr:LysR family transcriptional regulator [Caulobacteraceae bacterium]
MEKIDVRKTDFHALLVLITVHRLGSLTLAANELGQNQSTISYTVGRLRKVFADELFVRIGHGVVPTVRCEEVVESAKALLADFEGLIAMRDFNPALATAADRFTVSCNFYERTLILPGITRRMQQEAPLARISVQNASVRGHAQLIGGECDLLLSPVRENSQNVYRRKLLEDHYMCFVDSGSVFARGGLDLDAYVRARHVVVLYESSWRPFYMTTLEEMGIETTPAVTLPSFGAIDRIMADTDLVLTAPSGLAAVFGDRCVAVEAPFRCAISIYMYWSGRTHGSASHAWLRDLAVASAVDAGKGRRPRPASSIG